MYFLIYSTNNYLLTIVYRHDTYDNDNACNWKGPNNDNDNARAKSPRPANHEGKENSLRCICISSPWCVFYYYSYLFCCTKCYTKWLLQLEPHWWQWPQTTTPPTLATMNGKWWGSRFITSRAPGMTATSPHHCLTCHPHFHHHLHTLLLSWVNNYLQFSNQFLPHHNINNNCLQFACLVSPFTSLTSTPIYPVMKRARLANLEPRFFFSPFFMILIFIHD